MELIDPRDFVKNGIFTETDFREAVAACDWSRYKDKPVLIAGCAGGLIMPTWAHLVLTAEVAPFAKSISYGELSRPIPVFGKLGAASST